MDATGTNPVQRDAPLDALRVVALLGVFAVNWIGYLNGPYFPSPLGPAVPAESGISQAIIGILMTCLQGKAYPLMAFALGYSLQAAWLREARRSDPLQATSKRRARDVRMGLLGLAHGFLLYAGDILLAYAIVGLVVVRYAVLSPRQLRAKWRKWLIIWLMIYALVLAFVLSPLASGPGTYLSYAATSGDWAAWWSLNASAYSATLQSACLLLMPQLLCFAAGGMWAARWRMASPSAGLGVRDAWTTRFWTRCSDWRWLVCLLAINAVLAWIWLQDPEGQTALGRWVLPLWYPASGVLSVAYLAAFMRWARQPSAQATVARIARAAPCSLSSYLLLSVLMVLSLHSGVLASEDTLARTATALAIYVVVMWLAARAGRGWLETWVSGR